MKEPVEITDDDLEEGIRIVEENMRWYGEHPWRTPLLHGISFLIDRLERWYTHIRKAP
jgi:hypothetical protein